MIDLGNKIQSFRENKGVRQMNKNEKTIIRFFCKCTQCKEKWVEDLPAVNNHVTEYWGNKHLETCEKLQALYNERLNWNRDSRAFLNDPDGRFSAYDASYQARILYIKADRLNYKRIPEPTQCDGRCMSALGPNCDCQCGGENHGKNHIH